MGLLIPQQWRLQFARQASSDFEVYDFLCKQANFSACHRLHYLQMACEKTAKAFGWPDTGLSRDSGGIWGNTHSVLVKQLPAVFKQGNFNKQGPQARRFQTDEVRRLCREIELLQPVEDDDGQRPDNCEYPWNTLDNQGQPTAVRSPLDQSFATFTNPHNPLLHKFIKVIRAELRDLLSALEGQS